MELCSPAFERSYYSGTDFDFYLIGETDDDNRIIISNLKTIGDLILKSFPDAQLPEGISKAIFYQFKYDGNDYSISGKFWEVFANFQVGLNPYTREIEFSPQIHMAEEDFQLFLDEGRITFYGYDTLVNEYHRDIAIGGYLDAKLIVNKLAYIIKSLKKILASDEHYLDPDSAKQLHSYFTDNRNQNGVRGFPSLLRKVEDRILAWYPSSFSTKSDLDCHITRLNQKISESQQMELQIAGLQSQLSALQKDKSSLSDQLLSHESTLMGLKHEGQRLCREHDVLSDAILRAQASSRELEQEHPRKIMELSSQISDLKRELARRLEQTDVLKQAQLELDKSLQGLKKQISSDELTSLKARVEALTRELDALESAPANEQAASDRKHEEFTKQIQILATSTQKAESLVSQSMSSNRYRELLALYIKMMFESHSPIRALTQETESQYMKMLDEADKETIRVSSVIHPEFQSAADYYKHISLWTACISTLLLDIDISDDPIFP